MYRARHAKRSGGPKLGKLLAMTGLAGALVLSLALPAAMAGPKSQSNGGSKAYVTDDPCDQQLEQNQIAAGSEIFANLKMPGDAAQLLTFTIYPTGTSGVPSDPVAGPINLTPIACPDAGNLWYVLVTDNLYEPGSYTLVVDYASGDNEGKNFSSDSFLIYVPEA